MRKMTAYIVGIIIYFFWWQKVFVVLYHASSESAFFNETYLGLAMYDFSISFQIHYFPSRYMLSF
jgi:hypothetical protein